MQLQNTTSPHENKVLFIETKATVFGGQKALLARCTELDRLGIEYGIIHPFSKSDFMNQYMELGLKGKVFTPKRSLNHVCQVAFILRKLCQKYTRQQTHTIHCDAFDSAYIVAALRKIGLLHRQKIIFTVRSERYLRFNVLDRFLLTAFDQLCTNSDYSKAQINAAIGHLEHDIAVTYSPIDLAALPQLISAENVSGSIVCIGYVGSFDARKRLDRFVNFGLDLMRKMPNWTFQFKIYGEAKTPEQKALHQTIVDLIAEQHAQEAFVFEGYCPVSVIAEQIDLLFCPFDNEPLGRVVPEFLYMGRPVIAHDAGGLREAGAGYATMLLSDTEKSMSEKFCEAVQNIISGPKVDANVLNDMRQVLLSQFDRSAVVVSELAHYQLPLSVIQMKQRHE